MTWFLDLYRLWDRKRAERRLWKSVEGEVAENFLALLLKVMRLSFKLNKDFRRNITGFTGRFQFKSADNSIAVAAIFTGQELKVKRGSIPAPDVSVIFKDGKSLMNYLLSRDRDILKMLLNNEVVLRGNANYLFKFGYMANQLQLDIIRRLRGN